MALAQLIFGIWLGFGWGVGIWLGFGWELVGSALGFVWDKDKCENPTSPVDATSPACTNANPKKCQDTEKNIITRTPCKDKSLLKRLQGQNNKVGSMTKE